MFGAFAIALLLSQAESPVCGPAATLSFAEGAPVDRFTLVNRSEPPWRITGATIDLSGSAGRLVFDTRPGGPGRNVSQPFRALSGGPLASVPEVPDGSEGLSLSFAGIAPGGSFAFTIDMDDRVTGRAGTTIAGAELEGARLSVTFSAGDDPGETHAGRFDALNRAIASAPCLS